MTAPPSPRSRRSPRSPRTRRAATTALTALVALGLAAAAPARGGAPAEAPVRPAMSTLPPPPAAASGASGAIDPVAAADAYLAEVPTEVRSRSDAYFEGGYVLQVVGVVWASGVYLLLLATGLSARMRDRAERLTRRRPLQVALYGAQFAVVTSILSLPLALYADWLREHQYGLSNLTLGAWLGEQAKGLGVGVVFTALGVTALYAVVRRAGRSWWIWGAVVAVALLALGALVAPVAIVPIFNSPRRLADSRVTAPILRLARANGIATGDVWEVDASRQTTRISANVSGLLGTERITLNDNLLARCSLPEIEAVMAHEMGHYVLNHVYKGLLEFGAVIAVGLALVHAAFERLRSRHGARWGVRDLADPAGLPLAALVLGVFFFLAMPVTNSIVRVAEVEADLYGLNAARQPDGFARVALKLGDYRKLAPGPLEELVFFDHPSGRSRILAAMRWKAEHPETWKAAAGE